MTRSCAKSPVQMVSGSNQVSRNRNDLSQVDDRVLQSKPSSSSKPCSENLPEKGATSPMQQMTKPKQKPPTWKLKHVQTITREYSKPKDYCPRFCYLCRIQLADDDSYAKHSEEHGTPFRLLRRADDRVQDGPLLRLQLDYRPGFAKTMVYVRNISPNPIVLLNAVYLHLINGQLITLFESDSRIPWGSYATFTFRSNLLSKVQHDFALVLVGLSAPGVEYIEHSYLQVSELSHFLSDQLVLKRPLIHCTPLNDYQVPKIVRDLYEGGFSKNGTSPLAKGNNLLDKLDTFKREGLNPKNYVEYLNVLNQIEDFHMQVEYTKYRIESAKLTAGISEKFYRLTVDQFQTVPTLLDEECSVRIIIPSEFEAKRFHATIHKIHPDYMILYANKSLDPAPTYTITFDVNRLSYQLEYLALSLLKTIDIEKLLFPKLPRQKKVEFENLEWCNKNITTNPEQMIAIKNIVNRTAFPAPYVLFGPPGTGKTSTLVEAVVQIYKLQPKANILVSASSNYACDEFTKRLLEFLPANDVFRFLSKSCEKNFTNIDEAVLDISNLSSGTYTLPSWHDIYNSRVVIATITICGRLAQAKIDPTHFGYIFIDEAGSIKEIAALVPIAGVGTNGKDVLANVILSEDPKQLGPLIRHEYLRDTVQQTSMLERLMNHDIYCKDLVEGTYNSLVITKLLDNYRSHRHMLQFSNNAFYDGELRNRAPSSATDWAIGWPELPRKNFPLFFHSVRGTTEKDANSSSLYNCQEANQIVAYIERILSDGIGGRLVAQQDIGVISPYTKQVLLIKTLCSNKGWDMVEVGSTEQYQGREKPIILISTVRSATSSVGFLCNEKRLNVAITRARALMIIVGNPDTLQQDVHWYTLIKYCVDNRAFKGSEFTLVAPYLQRK